MRPSFTPPPPPTSRRRQAGTPPGILVRDTNIENDACMVQPPSDVWSLEVVLREAARIAHALGGDEPTDALELRVRRLSDQQLKQLGVLVDVILGGQRL